LYSVYVKYLCNIYFLFHSVSHFVFY
jgi:hypothetical protein